MGFLRLCRLTKYLVMRKERKYNLSEQKEFRRDLRKGMTSAEVVLWKMLSGRRLDGLKFRRQFGVGPYVLDFYCPELRLAVELDGRPHFSDMGMAYDHQRSVYLEREHGIHVLRFENRDVFESPETILYEIRCFREKNIEKLPREGTAPISSPIKEGVSKQTEKLPREGSCRAKRD